MCQWHIVLNMYVINILSSTVCITSAFTVQIRKSMFTFYSSNPENGKHFSFANERKATVIEKNRNDHWIRFPVKEFINYTRMSWMKKTSGHTTIDLIKLCWIHTYTHTHAYTHTHTKYLVRSNSCCTGSQVPISKKKEEQNFETI